MATARELLEQADALMRRNRSPEAAAADDAAGDIPLLTEAVDGGDGSLPGVSRPEARRAPGGDAAAPVPVAAAPVSEVAAPVPEAGARRSAVNVPVLTEIVEDFDTIAVIDEPDDAIESPWLDFDDGASAAPTLPKAGAAAPPAAGDADADADAARWEALAEEVRMQVLQRLDIFTDTGMQKQLTARLQPIVDRASADLVATINQQVGQLLRAYVAEAIEREIDKWRHGGGA